MGRRERVRGAAAAAMPTVLLLTAWAPECRHVIQPFVLDESR